MEAWEEAGKPEDRKPDAKVLAAVLAQREGIKTTSEWPYWKCRRLLLLLPLDCLHILGSILVPGLQNWQAATPLHLKCSSHKGLSPAHACNGNKPQNIPVKCLHG